MKRRSGLMFWLLAAVIVLGGWFWYSSAGITNSKNNSMKLESPAFENGGVIPVAFTCKGDGHNPPLRISEVPGDAASLALIVDDADAPGGEFVHWITWDIGRDTTLLDEGLPPDGGVEGQNSLGRVGYVAPCPPSGTHRYYFKLYAVDKILELNETTTKDELVRAMTGHIIDQIELMGTVSADPPAM